MLHSLVFVMHSTNKISNDTLKKCLHVLTYSFPPPRGLHAAVCFSFSHCRGSTVFHGAGSWTKHSPRQHRCMEAHLPKAGRDRLLQLHCERGFLIFVLLTSFCSGFVIALYE